MKPLSDIRIISLEQYGAGPYGSLQLADLGAEIIKIEDPRFGGDVGRYVPPFAEGEDSLFFEAFNRNKKSINLDVTNEQGRKVFEELVACSDAVYSNLRGDVPAKLKIRYEDLKHINPAIVCCSLSGFGMTGARAKEPAYDYILQGLAGWMDVTGEPDGLPTKSGLSLVDYSGGYVAAISLLAGLHGAKATGIGMDCDVSLFDTALSLLTYLGSWHLTEGFEPQRMRQSAHPSLVPFQNFETSTGWIVVSCAKEKFWQLLVKEIGLSELADDERFAKFRDRDANRDVILPLLENRIREESSQHWLELLGAAGIPCAPINDIAGALADQQTIDRQMIIETDHPRYGKVRTVGSAARVGPPGNDRDESRRAPLLNEDAHYVMADLLGYDDAKIASLTEIGAFGKTD